MEKKANILGKTREGVLSLAAKFADKRMSALIENNAPSDPVAASVWNTLLDSHVKENEPKLPQIKRRSNVELSYGEYSQ